MSSATFASADLGERRYLVATLLIDAWLPRAVERDLAAAERKAARGERDAAEKQAAAEAAAAKRAALLQKIRIKKANEQIKIVERPANPFSGQSDGSARLPGETVVEWKSRQVKKDIDEFHRRADDIDAAYQKQIEEADAKRRQLNEDYYNAGTNKERAYEIEKQRLDMVARMDALAKERDDKIHDLVSQFSEAHGNGLAKVSSRLDDYQFTQMPGVRTDLFNEVKQQMGKVWGFLGRVTAGQSQASIAKQKLNVVRGGGGSHNSDTNEINLGTQHSADQDGNIIDAAENRRLMVKTGIHEYGHAIESDRPGTMRALAEDYFKRRDAYLSANPGSSIVSHRYAPNYDGPASKTPDRDAIREWLTGPSLLGYARRYSDFGFKEPIRMKDPNKARTSGGTEVFSTGVEELYVAPWSFRRHARSHFDIVLLVLSNRL